MQGIIVEKVDQSNRARFPCEYSAKMKIIMGACKIEELNEYLPSMKFDSYYDDNLLPPEVGENAAALS